MTPSEKKIFDAGFERAMLLVFGSNVKWKDSERRIANRVSRRLFGRKRSKAKP